MQKVPPCSPPDNLYYPYLHKEHYADPFSDTGFTYQENSWKWITRYTYFTQYNVHPRYCIDMLFNISPSTFLGALPPVDLQAVCFVRAMVWAPPYITPSPSAVAWQARRGTGVRERRQHNNACKQLPSVFLNVVSTTSTFCFVLESKELLQYIVSCSFASNL